MTMENPINKKLFGDVSRRKTKTEATRRGIIEASCKVFSNYPYDAASIRIIGQEGGFTHSFIRYHFKSKAGLFEAVSTELLEQYYKSATELIRVLDGPLIKNTELLVDRFVDFAFDNPAAFYIIMLNMGAVDHVKDAFPGICSLRRFNMETLAVFASSNYFPAPIEDVNRVFFCFSIILTNCIGAADFFGKILNVDPGGRAYRRWVKDFFVFLLYPSVKTLVFSGKDGVRPVPVSTEVDRAQWQLKESDIRKKITDITKHALALVPDSPALKKLLTDMETSGLKTCGEKTTRRTRAYETKGQFSRRRIIAVARKVFSRYPYNAASIRMIGEEGGFDFTLLYHYFPQKAELFEAVASQLLEEYMIALTAIIKELNAASMRQNMLTFINNTMDYCFKQPDVMKACMQNIAQVDKFEDQPGFGILSQFLLVALRMLREIMPLPESDERVRMWMYGFGIVVFNCVGASSYHAQIVGMKSNSAKYKQWVKDTLMYFFYPSFKELVFGVTRSRQ